MTPPQRGYSAKLRNASRITREDGRLLNLVLGKKKAGQERPKAEPRNVEDGHEALAKRNSCDSSGCEERNLWHGCIASSQLEVTALPRGELKSAGRLRMCARRFLFFLFFFDSFERHSRKRHSADGRKENSSAGHAEAPERKNFECFLPPIGEATRTKRRASEKIGPPAPRRMG